MIEFYDLQSDERYMDQPPTTTAIGFDKVPQVLRDAFKTYEREARGDYLSAMDEFDIDDVSEDDVTIDYGVSDDGAVIRFGVHEPSPYNPSGWDFYFSTTGAYMGWSES